MERNGAIYKEKTMEKIYTLNEKGEWEDISTLDEAIKEQVKKNERDKRDDGDVREDKGEAGDMASS